MGVWRTAVGGAVRRLLGHQSVTATSSYLGVEDAAELARKFSF